MFNNYYVILANNFNKMLLQMYEYFLFYVLVLSQTIP